LLIAGLDRDHETRNAWIGPSFPLDLSALPLKSEDIPLQYPSLSASNLHLTVYFIHDTRIELGYSVTEPTFTLEERRKLGANVEHILAGEREAARAPRD
jgi:DOPA 4,5-dioxygenase